MLDEIVRKQKINLQQLMQQMPLSSFESKITKADFLLSKTLKGNAWSLIAECKLASPVKGVFKQEKTIEQLATLYEKNGAKALSVHTNEYFKGRIDDLDKIKKASSLPIMRKDFIIHPYQIYQTAYHKADALLLIARILSDKDLKLLLGEAQNLGLDCLVEVHDQKDIEKALNAGAKILGINNRDLKTFVTNVDITIQLKQYCKDSIVISESGIKSKEDLDKVKACNVNGVLIGEGLVTADDIEKQIRIMAGG